MPEVTLLALPNNMTASLFTAFLPYCHKSLCFFPTYFQADSLFVSKVFFVIPRLLFNPASGHLSH